MNTQTSKEGAAIRASGHNLAAEQTAVPAMVQSAPAQEKSEWQKAIDEGVCTVDEFCDQLLRLIDEHYDRLEKCAKS